MLAPVPSAAADPPARCPFAAAATAAPAIVPPEPVGFYCAPTDDGGVTVPPHRRADQIAADRVAGWLADRVDPAAHPCVAARAAFNAGAHRFGLYGPPASPGAAADLAADLRRFLTDGPAAAARGESGDDPYQFATFIAVFDAPGRPGAVPDRFAHTDDPEAAFEAALWAQLAALHAVDGDPWDPATAADPAHDKFSFSFAGTSFYVIGMHPDASRPARRFPRPALVFNLHAQFERLRASGRYEKMRDVIRDRDRRQTGSMNPMLTDFGRRSEARQYSGRVVGDDWRCPFAPKPRAAAR